MRLRTALNQTYGDRLKRAVVFGSRARGDYRHDSDYDIAVFLDNYGDFGQEAKSLAHIETAILSETGAVINSLPFPVSAYQDKTGFMQEIRREGSDI